jgi:hypothetical protein
VDIEHRVVALGKQIESTRQNLFEPISDLLEKVRIPSF